MELSIVIPTFNRKKKLNRLIKKILKSVSLKYPSKFEIIIVDDCSTDNSYEFIKRKYKKVPNLRIFQNKSNRRKSYCVNFGYQMSKGKFIYFLDDDTLLNEYSINPLIDYLKNNGNNHVLGSLICYKENPKIIWFAGLKMNKWTTSGKFLYQNINITQLNKIAIIPTDGIITSLFLHRDAFIKIGFFNSNLFPFHFEELDFCIRAKFQGYNLNIIPDSIIWHDHEKAIFIKTPWRLYFEVRNRIIAAKLWSNHFIQCLSATIFALYYPFIYLIIKIFIYPNSLFACLRSLFRGVKDGLMISLNQKPYYIQYKR